MEAVVGDAAAEGAFQVAALVGQFQDVQVLAADQVAAVVEQQQRQQLFQVFLTRVPSCVPTFSLSFCFFLRPKRRDRTDKSGAASGDACGSRLRNPATCSSAPCIALCPIPGAACNWKSKKKSPQRDGLRPTCETQFSATRLRPTCRTQLN